MEAGKNKKKRKHTGLTKLRSEGKKRIGRRERTKEGWRMEGRIMRERSSRERRDGKKRRGKKKKRWKKEVKGGKDKKGGERK